MNAQAIHVLMMPLVSIPEARLAVLATLDFLAMELFAMVSNGVNLKDLWKGFERIFTKLQDCLFSGEIFY